VNLCTNICMVIKIKLRDGSLHACTIIYRDGTFMPKVNLSMKILILRIFVT